VSRVKSESSHHKKAPAPRLSGGEVVLVGDQAGVDGSVEQGVPD